MLLCTGCRVKLGVVDGDPSFTPLPRGERRPHRKEADGLVTGQVRMKLSTVNLGNSTAIRLAIDCAAAGLVAWQATEHQKNWIGMSRHSRPLERGRPGGRAPIRITRAGSSLRVRLLA